MGKMISRIIEQIEPIKAVLSADRKTSHIVPTWQDMDVLNSIHTAISHLAGLTDILSGDEYVTISAVIPIVDLIEKKLLASQSDDTELLKSLKESIVADLKQRYQDPRIRNILDVSSFLDPRFKTKYINDIDARLQGVKMLIESEGVALYKEAYNNNTSSTSASSASIVDLVSTTSTAPKPKKKKLGTLFKDNIDNDEDEHESLLISPEQRISAEIKTYLDLPRLDFEAEILPWWKSQSLNYPLLSMVAKKYLSICATSSPSEHLFSTSGGVVSQSRASLQPDKVNMLTFLAKNL